MYQCVVTCFFFSIRWLIHACNTAYTCTCSWSIVWSSFTQGWLNLHLAFNDQLQLAACRIHDDFLCLLMKFIRTFQRFLLYMWYVHVGSFELATWSWLVAERPSEGEEQTGKPWACETNLLLIMDAEQMILKSKKSVRSKNRDRCTICAAHCQVCPTLVT